MLHTHIPNHSLESSPRDFSLTLFPQLSHQTKSFHLPNNCSSPEVLLDSSFSLVLRVRYLLLCNVRHSGLRHACLSFRVRNTGTAFICYRVSGATVEWRCQPSQGLVWGSPGEDAATVVLGRIPFLVGYRTEGSHSLLPIGSSPHGPLHVAAHSITTSRQEPIESASKTDVTGLCAIILEVASHHCCHIVLVRSKAQACPHSRKGINTQERDPREAGLTGAVLISVYIHPIT